MTQKNLRMSCNSNNTFCFICSNILEWVSMFGVSDAKDKLNKYWKGCRLFNFYKASKVRCGLQCKQYALSLSLLLFEKGSCNELMCIHRLCIVYWMFEYRYMNSRIFFIYFSQKSRLRRPFTLLGIEN